MKVPPGSIGRSNASRQRLLSTGILVRHWMTDPMIKARNRGSVSRPGSPWLWLFCFLR